MNPSPYLIKEPTCISFSGGRTSAYMLYRILEANEGLPEEAIVCFANTGKEEEATLKFVQDCSDHWKVPIHWLEYRVNKPGFERVNIETASRNGARLSLWRLYSQGVRYPFPIGGGIVLCVNGSEKYRISSVSFPGFHPSLLIGKQS